LGGKKGRGASAKTPVFKLLKRNGREFTIEVVKNCNQRTINAN
jgi:transposase